jgi:uncharacterized protein YpmS
MPLPLLLLLLLLLFLRLLYPDPAAASSSSDQLLSSPQMTAAAATASADQNRITVVSIEEVEANNHLPESSDAENRSLGSRASRTLRRWGQFLAAQRACLIILTLLSCFVILVTILVIAVSGPGFADGSSRSNSTTTFKLIDLLEDIVQFAATTRDGLAAANPSSRHG